MCEQIKSKFGDPKMGFKTSRVPTDNWKSRKGGPWRRWENGDEVWGCQKTSNFVTRVFQKFAKKVNVLYCFILPPPDPLPHNESCF